MCKKASQFKWDGGATSFRDVVNNHARSIDKSSSLTVVDFDGDGKSS